MGSADESSESDHHAPAPADWPRGFGEASWWPLATAVGAAGLYAGAALALLARGEDAIVGPALPSVLLVGGVGIFLASLYGWTYHGFVARYWKGAAGDGLDLRWGMVLFLATDVMTFAAGFVYFFFVRTGPWPPGELPHLLSSLVAINTAVLVASSVTLHVAHESIRGGHRRRFLAFLGATVVLGVVFVGGQLLEYYELLVVEGAALTDVFGSAFFALTGLHGLHVALGVILLAIVLVRAGRGQFSAERHTAVATTSMYWHFVDAVWLFLVVTLYVGSVA
ncbi:heme-copper oxidase subunit III [Saliphagus sp. LR7]|uniref:cytochrome c oxidase subunit 3 n=1 Tax=Saliphagus sp. LR7 TaxID=2282654 RepID=UPI000DF821B0|nr:heme-copper oxidase subunit III [Saliphagus sp. LR7]